MTKFEEKLLAVKEAREKAMMAKVTGVMGDVDMSDAKIIEYLARLDYEEKKLMDEKAFIEKRKSFPATSPPPDRDYEGYGKFKEAIRGFKKKLPGPDDESLLGKFKKKESITKPAPATFDELLSTVPEYCELTVILSLMKATFERSSSKTLDIVWDCHLLAGMIGGGDGPPVSTMTDHSVVMFRIIFNGARILKEEMQVPFGETPQETVKAVAQRVLLSMVCSGISQMLTTSAKMKDIDGMQIGADIDLL